MFVDGGVFNASNTAFAQNTAQGGAGGLSNALLTDNGSGGGGMGANANGQNSGAGGAGGGVNGGSGSHIGGQPGGFGGGGGGSQYSSHSPGAGIGGTGGFGGGGGGGAAGAAGGAGGFGGGGGGGGYLTTGQNAPGGMGGYGGAAGANGEGGGGAGMGGAVFGRGGTINLTGDTFTSNTAAGGIGGGGSADGSGDGGALFLINGQLTATSNTFSGDTGSSNIPDSDFYQYFTTVSQLSVSAPGNLTAGAAATVTIEAEDQYGDIIANFSDSVALTDGLGSASFGSISFANGVATVTATLDKVAAQTVTATDTAMGSTVSAGTSGPIIVTPAAANELLVSASPTYFAAWRHDEHHHHGRGPVRQRRHGLQRFRRVVRFARGSDIRCEPRHVLPGRRGYGHRHAQSCWRRRSRPRTTLSAASTESPTQSPWRRPWPPRSRFPSPRCRDLGRRTP